MTDSVGLLLDKLESKDKTIADQHQRLAVWDRALGQWESDRAALVARIAVLTEALEYYASNYSADSLIGFRAKEALAQVKGAEHE